MLAADAELQVGPRLAAALGGDLDELAHALRDRALRTGRRWKISARI